MFGRARRDPMLWKPETERARLADFVDMPARLPGLHPGKVVRMERFSFDLRRPDAEVPDEDGAPAPNLDTAISQAVEAVREMITLGRVQPSIVASSVLVVRNADNRVVAN